MKSVSDKVRDSVMISRRYSFFKKYEDQLMLPVFLGQGEMYYGIGREKSGIHFGFRLRVRLNVSIFELSSETIIDFTRNEMKR